MFGNERREEPALSIRRKYVLFTLFWNRKGIGTRERLIMFSELNKDPHSFLSIDHRLFYTFGYISLYQETSSRLLQVICNQNWMKNIYFTIRLSSKTTLNSWKHSFGNGLKKTTGIQAIRKR